MNLPDINTQIIFLPIEFGKKNKSIYSLLEDTGYFETYDEVNEKTISQALTKHSDCIEHWLILSEDKRTESGWFFVKNDNTNKYIVANVTNITKREENEYFEFDNANEACSFFIKKEIEDIRTI